MTKAAKKHNAQKKGANPSIRKPMSEVVVVPKRALEERRQESRTLTDALLAAATNPAVDVEKMERLWIMHKEAEDRRAEQEFNVAKNALQPLLPVIKKNGLIEFIDKKNNARNTPYALREDIEKAIRPLYTEAGFSTEYDTEYVDGKIISVLILRHTGGYVREYRTPPMPLDTSGSKNNNQAAGSTVEYGRRYAIVGAFNIITEGNDDDGNHGRKPEPETGDKFAKRASGDGTVTEAKVEEVVQPDPNMKLSAAADTLAESLRSTEVIERRGEILMKNVKLLKALEDAGLVDTAIMLRELAEGRSNG